MLGTVKHFEKTYGFIARDDGERDVFVHFSAILGRPGAFRRLVPGERVGFETEQTERGLAARDVQRLAPPAAE